MVRGVFHRISISVWGVPANVGGFWGEGFLPREGVDFMNKSPLVDILSLIFVVGVLTLIAGLPWMRDLWWSMCLGAAVLSGCLLAIIDQN